LEDVLHRAQRPAGRSKFAGDLLDDLDAAALDALLDAVDAVDVDLRAGMPRMIASVPCAMTFAR
jgi:hypothetical protein